MTTPRRPLRSWRLSWREAPAVAGWLLLLALFGYLLGLLLAVVLPWYGVPMPGGLP